jgi:exodeoxyribonuclease V alpha subunit
MGRIELTEKRLKSSGFRSSFSLKAEDLEYIDRVGLVTIESHASDFIEKRLDKEKIKNDGKQTPFKGHPVFIAQHATATCCRKCVKKWHNIPRGRKLTCAETGFFKKIIMRWIRFQYSDGRGLS